MKRITWLASYPKSGNTWTRIFLNNLQSDDKSQSVCFNELKEIDFSHASGRQFANQALGYCSSLLTPEELRAQQANIYRHFSSKLEKNITLKNHDAYTFTNGDPDFPADVSRGAIYILRNPLEVACSYANHNSCSIDRAIEQMAEKDHTLAKSIKKPSNQLPQPMGTWSAHVQSWLAVSDFPVLVIRYEDMHHDALNTFTKIANFLDFDADEANISRAIELSSFDKVQKQEKEKPFKEKPLNTEKFFRQGLTDGWKKQLTSRQIEQIIADHGPTMKQFDYLDADNKPA